MRCVVTDDPKEFAKRLFEAGQQPAAWPRSAGHLRDAAEAILKHELPAERSYSQAFKIADEEAVAESVRGDTGVGAADIKAIAPNYPPAQLLYAYAIENVLKGLMVSKRPDLIQEHKLHGELKKHDLNKLAKKAKVTVEQHERPVLEALTHLSIAAGRYPIALEPSVDSPNPNELLGYAPRTGGAYDSHHRTAGIAGCTRRRCGRVAARGARAAVGDAGDRILHARSPNFASPDHWTPRRVSEIIPSILAGSKVRHPIVLAISVNWLTHARACVLFA